jgi:hypothetical protein
MHRISLLPGGAQDRARAMTGARQIEIPQSKTRDGNAERSSAAEKRDQSRQRDEICNIRMIAPRFCLKFAIAAKRHNHFKNNKL